MVEIAPLNGGFRTGASRIVRGGLDRFGLRRTSFDSYVASPPPCAEIPSAQSPRPHAPRHPWDRGPMSWAQTVLWRWSGTSFYQCGNDDF